MKNFHVLRQVLKRTGAHKIWIAFLILFFASGAIMWLVEEQFCTYGEALWYCYTVASTVGFGDAVAQHMLSRALSVLLSISAAVVIALITSVIVNFYNQVTSIRNKETISAFVDKLERLPELSKEELAEMSRKVREFQKK